MSANDGEVWVPIWQGAGLRPATDVERALVEALKPFSVPSIAGLPKSYAPDCTSYNFPPNAITVGDLRRVDAALRAAGVEL